MFGYSVPDDAPIEMIVEGGMEWEVQSRWGLSGTISQDIGTHSYEEAPSAFVPLSLGRMGATTVVAYQCILVGERKM